MTAERRFRFAAFGLLSVYFLQAFYHIYFSRSHTDESYVLINSWWYVSGVIQPYGPEDRAWYMPVMYYFYGLWQKIFGIGHVSARMGNAMLGLACLGLMTSLGRNLSERKEHALWPMAIFALTPMAILYFAIAGPYSLVTMFLLLCLLLLTRQNEFRWWITSLGVGVTFYLIHFTRPQMIFSVPLLSLYQGLTAENRKIRRVTLSLAAAFTLGWITLSAFPKKLAYYALQIPVVTDKVIEIAKSRWSVNLDPYHELWEVFPEGIFGVDPTYKHTWGWGDIETVRTHFWHYYHVVTTLCLIGFAMLLYDLVRERSLDPLRRLGPFSCLFFVVIESMHVLGALEYAYGGMPAYSVYPLGVGCLGGAWALSRVTEWMVNAPKPSIPSLLTWCVPLIVAALWIARMWEFQTVFFCLGLAGLLVYKRFRPDRAAAPLLWMSLWTSWLGLSALSYVRHAGLMVWSDPRKTYIEEVHATKQFITDRIPAGSKILVIGGQPRTTEGVWLAASRFNPVAMGQPQTYRRMLPNVDPKKKARALELLDELALWTDDLMKKWIERDYEYVLATSGGLYPQYTDYLEKNFDRIGVMQEEIFILFRRKRAP